MKRILILGFFISILTSFVSGQIQIGGSQPKAPKSSKSKKDKTIKSVNDTTVYSMKVFAGTTFGTTYRTLEPNKNELFADSLGYRADERSKAYWSFHIGFTSDINKHLMWEAGVSFMRNGEQNSFSSPDTSYNYVNRHSWIGVPLKLYFKHDLKKIRFQIGVGAIPHMQLKYKSVGMYTDINGKEISTELKTIKGMNNFGVSLIGNAGIHYSFTKRIGMYLQFEYRHQLTSSYWKTDPYIHRGTVIGANLGLTFGL